MARHSLPRGCIAPCLSVCLSVKLGKSAKVLICFKKCLKCYCQEVRTLCVSASGVGWVHILLSISFVAGCQLTDTGEFTSS